MQPFTIDQSLQFALAHHRAGRLADAEGIYRNILSRNPRHGPACNLLGALAVQTGRCEMAIGLLRRAISAEPWAADYHCNLGEALRTAGKTAEAIDAFREAIRLNPRLATAHNNLGISLTEAGRAARAIDAYQQAIAIQPDYAEAFGNLGNALKGSGRFDEAIIACRRAGDLKPQDTVARNNLAAALAAADQIDEAIDVYRQAIALEPGFAEARTNLANALTAGGRIAEAIPVYQDALRLSPDSVAAHWNYAVALLRSGDFERGWPEHEWRLKAKSQFPVRQFDQPQWRGEDLAGRTIMLHAEQGFGDTIQFVRYVPLVAARGGRVILECQPQLRGLLAGFPGAEQVIARGDALPPFELHCPMLSLPLAFNTRAETTPGGAPYLTAQPQQMRAWENIVAVAGARPKIGLAWAGSATHSNNRNRSIALAQFAPLAAADATFFSLAHGPAAEQAADDSHGLQLIDARGRIDDFIDTAALIANLDLVITVDTAVAHLSGALGKPTWVLLPFVPDWRWMMKRSDSPWYPTMRLFRQPGPGDWPAVLRDIAQAISSPAGPKSSCGGDEISRARP